MAKLLAIEWDDREIRAVAGSSTGGRIVVEQILREPIQPSGEATTPNDIAKALNALTNQHGLKRARTFVSIGRSSVELKELTLPPASDDDLPDLVRFQAMREFNALGEDWQLDFLPLPGDPEQQRLVLAAAISPTNLAHCTQICQTAGLQLDQIVLRPCASATLIDQFAPDTRSYRLFVDVLADELDLTVLAGSTPEFMRTARIYSGDPNAPVDMQRTILLEVRRTLAAVSNKLHGSKMDSLLLCGDGLNQNQLKELLETELKLPVQLFDPLSKVEINRALQANLPSHHSHFAPLVGLLVGAAAERAPQLDFLHPRKKSIPKSNKRQWSLVAGLAVVVVLAGLASLASKVWALDAEIADKNAQIAALTKNTKANDTTFKAMKELGEWKVTDFPVVTEMEFLSKTIPDAKSMKLTSFTFSPNKENGGRFVINGVAASSEVVSKMIRDLSEAKIELPHSNPKFKREAPRFIVKQDSLKDDKSNPPYSVSFSTTIDLQKQNPVAMAITPAAQLSGAKVVTTPRTATPAKPEAEKSEPTKNSKEKTAPTKPDAKTASPSTTEKGSKPPETTKSDEAKPEKTEASKDAQSDKDKAKSEKPSNDKSEKQSPPKSDSSSSKPSPEKSAPVQVEPTKAEPAKTAPDATESKSPVESKSDSPGKPEKPMPETKDNSDKNDNSEKKSDKTASGSST